MVSSKLILTAAFLIVQSAFAENVIEKKLFTMEKSYHSQNIMVINTQTDQSCKFVTRNSEYIDFYWLMNGQNRKEIHPMIRSQVKEKVKVMSVSDERDSFKIRMTDLNELKHDLEDTALLISSTMINGDCQVKSVLKLGASAKYRNLNLVRTYCEVSTNLLGIPKGCKFIDLQGTDADTGEALKVRFNGK